MTWTVIIDVENLDKEVAMEFKYALVDKEKGVELGNVVFLGEKLKPFQVAGKKVYVFILPDFVEDQDISNPLKLLFNLMNEISESCEIKLLPKVYEKLGVPRQSFYYWLRSLMAKGVLEKVDKHIYLLSVKGVKCRKQTKKLL